MATTRVNHAFKNVKYEGKRIGILPTCKLKELAVINTKNSSKPFWDKKRKERVPDKVEVAARKELALRGFKVVGISRVEEI